MLSSPIHYALPTESARRRVLRAVQSRYRTSTQTIPMRRTIYYDTFDWRIYKAGGTLSATTENGECVFVWKSLKGEVLRTFHAASVPSFAWDFPVGTFRHALEQVIEMRRLFPVVELGLQSHVLQVLDENEKTVARFHVESGTARKPETSGPAKRVATRLRISGIRGYVAAYDEALQLVEEELGLARDGSGEISLAMAAVGGAPNGISSMRKLVLDPTARSDDAARHIQQTLVETMVANEEGVRAQLDTEFLHDFRVAVRRTRTGLLLINDVFPNDVVEHFRQEFRWLGSVTGVTRDLDVFLLRMPDYRASLPEPVRPDLDSLERFLRAQQELEHQRTADALRSTRYVTLIRDWKKFLAKAPPRRRVPANARRPIREVAAECLSARFKRVFKKGRKIRPDSPLAPFHELRIECKKLRYLLEFFRSLYDPADLESLVSALKSLQDSLGNLNDLDVQREQLACFADQMIAQGATSSASFMAMGRLVAQFETSMTEERSRFEARFARFSRPKMRQRVRRLLTPRESDEK